MSKTYQGEHKATVKGFENGQPYIMFELLKGKEIPDFLNANVGVSFDDDTTYEQAQAIADTLNSKLKGLFVTKL